MSRRDDELPMTARVPADVERKDVVLFGLTFRQVVILGVTGLLLYTLWTALATTVPPLVFLIGAIPVAGVAFVVAVARRDGIGLDVWIWHGLRYRRSPRHLIPGGGVVLPPPEWVHVTGEPMPVPAPLRLPARGITAEGLIDLGPDGTTALLDASTVAFGLRTAGEQNSLIGGFAQWLNSLDGPVQILVRAERVDLTTLADTIHTNAAGLPHPALEAAALAHVAFLDELATKHELLHRRVTIAVRDTRGPTHTLHRASEAVRALASCEVTARLLTQAETAATVAAAMDPTGPPPRTAAQGTTDGGGPR